MEFVVNAEGRVDTATAVTRWAADPQFARAVREAMPCMRYVPARRDGRAVPELVTQSFWFDITRSSGDVADPRSAPFFLPEHTGQKPLYPPGTRP